MSVTNYYTVNGEIFGERTAGSPRVDYLTDALSSVTATVNQSALVVNTYRYKPFGALLAKTGTGPDPAFGWVGTQGYRPTKQNFSDFYVRARHYDSTTGRWPNVDPIGRYGGLNLFRYVENASVVFTDPTRLAKSKLECLAHIARIGKNFVKVVSELVQYDPVEDGKGGHKVRGGGRTKPGGHYEKIKNFQRGIKNDLSEFYHDCIDNDNDPGCRPTKVADIWANKFVPLPVYPDVSVWSQVDWKLAADRTCTAIEIGGLILIIVGAPETLLLRD